MPKVNRTTKKQEAEKLLKMLQDGPSFFKFDGDLTELEARRMYRLWAGTWIIPAVTSLVPELRRAFAMAEAEEAGNIILEPVVKNKIHSSLSLIAAWHDNKACPDVDGETIFADDGACKCGIGKHHYHCCSCGKIVQVG